MFKSSNKQKVILKIKALSNHVKENLENPAKTF